MHALALSASKFMPKKVPTNLYDYAPGGIELTKPTYYTRLQDNNLIRYNRGDRLF